MFADSNVMAVAHATESELYLPEFGHRRTPSLESGFSLIEVIVVLIIVAILMAIGIVGFRSMKESPSAPQLNTGAGRIWRAVQDYRFDNEGVFPTANMLTAVGGTGFVDLGGRRYVRNWPEGVRGAKFIVIQASGSATAPATGPKNVVLYHVNGPSAWMAAYESTGKCVFQRGVSASASPVVPIG